MENEKGEMRESAPKDDPIEDLREAVISAAKQLREEYRASLRDQFATAALTGMATRRTWGLLKFIRQDAEVCYVYADAMMEARK